MLVEDQEVGKSHIVGGHVISTAIMENSMEGLQITRNRTVPH